MAGSVLEKVITDQYALYCGDAMEVLPDLPACSVDFTVYSPPFGGLYEYSSSPRDLSNCRDYGQFLQQYEFILRELTRLTKPGCCSAVHCMDVPANANAGRDMIDLPGDVVRLHQRLGWRWAARHMVWKEPLAVRNRTMAKGLAHKQIVDDASLCDAAGADQLLIFRRPGKRAAPVAYPTGLDHYAGEREMPAELHKYRGWAGDQKKNRYSHWIWRRYASAFWDDVRLSRVLPFEAARDEQDERHVHPLQLDVIERVLVLRSNPGETVLTPFMGVGSEVYQAVRMGRRGVGVELKPTYYRQAVRNVAAGAAEWNDAPDQMALEFADAEAFAAAEGLE